MRLAAMLGARFSVIATDQHSVTHKLDLIHEYGIYAYVNLIPYNEVQEKPFKRSPSSAIKAFADRLMKRGINTTIRKEFGSDIDAACGQLRAKYMKKK